ncbi:MAG: hypothetical protein ACI3V1_06415 [Faecousia sp.]
MSAKNAILKALIEGVIVDLMVKTKVDNVYVDDTTTLAAKLAEIITSLNSKATTDALTSGLADKANASHTHAQSQISGLETALSSRPTTAQMNTAISKAISDLIGGAPATYDTLKEIADYITAHEDVVATLNAAIGNKADKSTFEAIQATVNALGSLANKSTVSETDLDANLKEKVNASAQGNHSHANKNLLDSYDQTNANIKDAVNKKHSHSNMTVLNSITAAKVSGWDGKCHLYVSDTKPDGMTENDLWAQIVE